MVFVSITYNMVISYHEFFLALSYFPCSIVSELCVGWEGEKPFHLAH